MANTYTWTVETNGLDVIPSADGQTNVVSAVRFNVTGTNGIYIAFVRGTQSLTYTVGSPFTSYFGLTQDAVIQWVQSAMGAEQVAAIKTNLDNQINNLINPPIITPPLPWNS